MSIIRHYETLDYKNVFLVPQYSEITSRSTVDTSSYLFENLELDVPVISANMDTITEYEMARAMYNGGGIGALHRFMTIEENVRQYKLFFNPDNPEVDEHILVSVGVNGDSEQRTQALYEAGARHFIIDIAHGHSKLMREAIHKIKSRYNRSQDPVYIMAGNIATQEATRDLIEWGADSIKVGIGPGSVCLTKNVTGVTFPQLSAVINCRQALDKSMRSRYITLVADGGLNEIGDVAKALAAGANAVMSGKLFASCMETPGPRINGRKVYRGMASLDAMKRIKPEDNLPTAEGTSILLNEEVTRAAEVVMHIKGGLQSAFSYSNAQNINQFKNNAVFGIRKFPV